MTVRFIFATIKKDIHIKKASRFSEAFKVTKQFTYRFQTVQQQKI